MPLWQYLHGPTPKGLFVRCQMPPPQVLGKSPRGSLLRVLNPLLQEPVVRSWWQLLGSQKHTLILGFVCGGGVAVLSLALESRCLHSSVGQQSLNHGLDSKLLQVNSTWLPSHNCFGILGPFSLESHLPFLTPQWVLH